MAMHWSQADVKGCDPPLLAKHTSTLVDHRVFMLGARYLEYDEATDTEVEVPCDLLVFDTDTMQWFRPDVSGEKPGAARAHTATLVENRIFMFGGGDGATYYNDLFVLDTRPRRAHTACAVGSKIYVFGGGDGNVALNETYILDTEKLSWSKMNASGAIPDPRGYHTATVFGDDIFIFGGSDTDECFSDVVVLETKTQTFTKKKLPSAKCRYSHSATAVGKWLFLFGGCDGEEYVDELEVLNTQTLEWLKVSVRGTPPSQRGYHSAVYHDSRLWVFGGAAGAEPYDDVYCLDLGVYAYLPMQ